MLDDPRDLVGELDEPAEVLEVRTAGKDDAARGEELGPEAHVAARELVLEALERPAGSGGGTAARAGGEVAGRGTTLDRRDRHAEEARAGDEEVVQGEDHRSGRAERPDERSEERRPVVHVDQLGVPHVRRDELGQARPLEQEVVALLDEPRQERDVDPVDDRTHDVLAFVRAVRAGDDVDVVSERRQLARLRTDDGLGPPLEVRVEVLGDEGELQAPPARSARSSPSGSPSGRNPSPWRASGERYIARWAERASPLCTTSR